MRSRKCFRALVPISKTRIEKDVAEDPSLEALNHSPDVKRLVSDILVFRAKMNREDASDRSPESKLPSSIKFRGQSLILNRDFFGLV